MGKLKEKLLNNLTPEEQEEMFGISAFEYVELMENYKNLFDDAGNPIPNDVVEQMANEREQLEREYYHQSELDEINDSIKLKYSDSDVLYAISKIDNKQWLKDGIMNVLNDVWNAKNGVE